MKTLQKIAFILKDEAEKTGANFSRNAAWYSQLHFNTLQYNMILHTANDRGEIQH